LNIQNLKQQFLEIHFIKYKSYDGTSAYLYAFLCCSSSVLCKYSNCMLWIIKKGGAIRNKIRTLLVSS